MQSVSVVIAAWNAASFITSALESALAQTGVEVEVIVVDDCSDDDTAAVVASLGDPRVRCVRQPRNGGPAAARNAGFALARHDWVAVLDSDDAMAADRLEKLTGAGRATGADIVADNFWIRAEGAPDRPFLDEPQDGATFDVGLAGFLDENLLFRSPRPLGYLKPVFRREFLIGHGLAYDTSLRIGEDCQLIIEALLQGGRYVRHRSTGYIYLTREGSISHRLGAAEAAAMARAERGVIDPQRHRLSSDERAACDRQLASLDTGAAFVDTVERLKRRDLVGAVVNVLRRPQLTPLFSMPLRARFGSLIPRLGASTFR